MGYGAVHLARDCRTPRPGLIALSTLVGMSLLATSSTGSTAAPPQTSAALVVHSGGKTFEGKLVYFIAIDGDKFRKPVVPGDTLHIHVKNQQSRRNVWKFQCEAKVGEDLCAEALVTAMIRDGAA